MPVLKPFAAVVFAVLVMSAALAGERPLTGDEIRAALSGNTVEGVQDGADWKQYFDRNGQTTYVSGGRASPGRWAVRGDRYCSQWPPSERWDCYRMTGEGDRMTFVPAGGGANWPAKVKKGNRL
ncbi:MAG: hypothetical protein ACR2PM_00500 [Hyphomicrobiales bacterium]